MEQQNAAPHKNLYEFKYTTTGQTWGCLSAQTYSWVMPQQGDKAWLAAN